MRFASLLACLIIVASWMIFATGQAQAGSNASRNGIDGLPAATTTTAPAAPKQKSDVRRRLDNADDQLLSPFSALTDGSSSDWVRQTIPALLGLLVYGFALSFAARCIPQRR